jgi:hypothetical protein
MVCLAKPDAKALFGRIRTKQDKEDSDRRTLSPLCVHLKFYHKIAVFWKKDSKKVSKKRKMICNFRRIFGNCVKNAKLSFTVKNSGVIMFLRENRGAVSAFTNC